MELKRSRRREDYPAGRLRRRKIKNPRAIFKKKTIMKK